MPHELTRNITALPLAIDEHILFRVRQSQLLLILQLLVIGLASGAVVFIFQSLSSPADPPIIGDLTLQVLGSLGAILAGGLVALVRLLEYFTTSYTLTTRRVQHDFGIFRRTSYAVPLTQVETLNVSQSLLGRILHYGDVLIRPTTAVPLSLITFRAVTNPQQRREEIENQLS